MHNTGNCNTNNRIIKKNSIWFNMKKWIFLINKICNETFKFVKILTFLYCVYHSNMLKFINIIIIIIQSGTQTVVVLLKWYILRLVAFITMLYLQIYEQQENHAIEFEAVNIF